jgi:hypothetical protein
VSPRVLPTPTTTTTTTTTPTTTTTTATATRDVDVLCFGEALVDLLPERRGPLDGCGRFEPCPGGAPANVATGLARLGLRVAFRGVVGDDPFGRLLARRLGAEGVECALRFAPERPTGLWFVALDERGERSFSSPNARFSADKLVAPGDVDRALLARARWLHVGTSAHVLPDGRGAPGGAGGAGAPRCARRWRRRGSSGSSSPSIPTCGSTCGKTWRPSARSARTSSPPARS